MHLMQDRTVGERHRESQSWPVPARSDKGGQSPGEKAYTSTHKGEKE